MSVNPPTPPPIDPEVLLDVRVLLTVVIITLVAAGAVSLIQIGLTLVVRCFRRR